LFVLSSSSSPPSSLLFIFHFPEFPSSHNFGMATTKTLEARFEHLSVKDEKENGNNERTYGKQKVLDPMQ
jgi:hypothetical protein